MSLHQNTQQKSTSRPLVSVHQSRGGMVEHPSSWQKDHRAKGVHIMVGWKAESRKEPGATITFKNMPLRTYLLQLNPTSSSSTASQSCANSRGTGTQHVSLEWTVAFQPKTPNHVKYGLGLEHGLWIPL